MATNRIRDLSIRVTQILPLSNPIKVKYTASWKPAERLSDPNCEVMVVSGRVNMTHTDTWADTRAAIWADIQAKMAGDTLEEGDLAS